MLLPKFEDIDDSAALPSFEDIGDSSPLPKFEDVDDGAALPKFEDVDDGITINAPAMQFNQQPEPEWSMPEQGQVDASHVTQPELNQIGSEMARGVDMAGQAAFDALPGPVQNDVSKVAGTVKEEVSAFTQNVKDFGKSFPEDIFNMDEQQKKDFYSREGTMFIKRFVEKVTRVPEDEREQFMDYLPGEYEGSAKFEGIAGEVAAIATEFTLINKGLKVAGVLGAIDKAAAGSAGIVKSSKLANLSREILPGSAKLFATLQTSSAIDALLEEGAGDEKLKRFVTSDLAKNAAAAVIFETAAVFAKLGINKLVNKYKPKAAPASGGSKSSAGSSSSKAGKTNKAGGTQEVPEYKNIQEMVEKDPVGFLDFWNGQRYKKAHKELYDELARLSNKEKVFLVKQAMKLSKGETFVPKAAAKPSEKIIKDVIKKKAEKYKTPLRGKPKKPTVVKPVSATKRAAAIRKDINEKQAESTLGQFKKYLRPKGKKGMKLYIAPENKADYQDLVDTIGKQYFTNKVTKSDLPLDTAVKEFAEMVKREDFNDLNIFTEEMRVQGESYLGRSDIKQKVLDQIKSEDEFEAAELLKDAEAIGKEKFASDFDKYDVFELSQTDPDLPLEVNGRIVTAKSMADVMKKIDPKLYGKWELESIDAQIRYQVDKIIDDGILKTDGLKELQDNLRGVRARMRGASPEATKARLMLEVEVAKKSKINTQIMRNNIYHYAKRVGIDAEVHNTVDTLLKNETVSVKQYRKAIDQIDRVLEKRRLSRLRKKVIKRVRSEFKRLRKLQRTPSRGQDADSNEKLREYLKSITTDGVDVGGIYKEHSRLVDNVKDVKNFTPEFLKRAASAVRKTFDQMNSHELEKVLGNINSLREKGHMVGAEKEMARLKKLEVEVERAVGEIKEVFGSAKAVDYQYESVRPKHIYNRDRNMESIKKYFAHSLRGERIIGFFDGFKKHSAMTQNIYNQLEGGVQTAFRGGERHGKIFEEIHKDVDIPAAMYDKLITLKTGKGQQATYTINQGMCVYAHSQNQAGVNHLEGTGIKEKTMEKIIKSLSAKHRAAVDAQIDYFDNVQWPRLTRWFREEYGVDLPKEFRYFPIMDIKTDNAETAFISEILSRNMNRGINKGMTKSRTGSNAPFRRLDYFGTVAKNMVMVEHLLAMAKPIRDVRAFLNHPEIKNAMNGVSTVLTREVHAWVERLAHGTARRSTSTPDKMADFFRRNYITGVLGYNARVILTQPVSFHMGAAQIRKKMYIAKALDEVFSNPIKSTEFVYKMSTMMRMRPNSIERDVQDALERTPLKNLLQSSGMLETLRHGAGETKMDKVRYLGEMTSELVYMVKAFGMEGIRVMDAVTTSILWIAKYNEALSNHSRKAAVKEADELIRKTQPMSRIIDLPKHFTEVGIARTFTTFLNQPNQNANVIFEETFKAYADGYKSTRGSEKAKIKAGRKSAKKKIAALMGIFTVAGVHLHLVRNGFDLDKLIQEPIGVLRTTFGGIIGGLPVINTVGDAALAGANRTYLSKKGYKPNAGFGTEFGVNVFSPVETILNGGAKDRMAEAAVIAFTGLSAGAVRKARVGIPQTLKTGDLRRPFYSDYSLAPLKKRRVGPYGR